MKIRKIPIFYLLLIHFILLLFFIVFFITFSNEIINHIFYLFTHIILIINIYKNHTENYKQFKLIISVLVSIIFSIILIILDYFVYIPYTFNSKIISTYKIDDSKKIFLRETDKYYYELIYEEKMILILKKTTIIKYDINREKIGKKEKFKDIKEIYEELNNNCPEFKCSKNYIDNIKIFEDT